VSKGQGVGVLLLSVVGEGGYGDWGSCVLLHCVGGSSVIECGVVILKFGIGGRALLDLRAHRNASM